MNESITNFVSHKSLTILSNVLKKKTSETSIRENRSKSSQHLLSKRAQTMRSKQALKVLKSQSQVFSKDIVTEDFYVLPTDEDMNIYEVDTHPEPKVSIHEPAKSKKEDLQEEFTLADDKEKPEGEEAAVETDLKTVKKKDDADEPAEDFFNKVVDEDEDKKKVVQEIAGMSEMVEEEPQEGREEEADRESQRQIHFEPPTEIPVARTSETERSRSSAGVTSQRSLDQSVPKTSLSKRSAGIPELMRLTRRSLIPIDEPSVGVKMSQSVLRKKSSVKKDGMETLLPTATDLEMRASKFDSKKSKSGDWDYTGMGGRYDDYDYDDLIAGFATTEDHPLFFDVIPEEEEEVAVIEEEKPIFLERGPYYERHDKAVEEIEIRKIRNFILHKKLAMYFKRKKMDYVTKETDWSFDAQGKYFKKLEAYGDLIDCISIEKTRLTKEIEDTRKQVDEKCTKLTNMFKKMQDREAEIGYGLINTKTGNVLLDKFVERLIRRQDTQMMQVSSMRLTYIRLKGMVQEKLDAIERLDEIAPGFQLADYEQLKSDNRAYADKIEEKDEELARLRAKCGNTIQVLAHLREKTTALESDLIDLMDARTSINSTVFAVRSQLNEMKQRRDSFRHATNRMKDESGLLTQPTLLIDMENGFEENKSLTVELKKLMKEYKKKASQIQIIRKKIEETVDTKRTIARKSVSRVTVRKSGERKEQLCKIYKGRPELMMPTIEDSAFNSLRTIKPKLTYDRSLRNRAKVKNEKRKEG